MQPAKANAVALAAAFCVGMVLSGCVYIARPAAGIPGGGDWVPLPLSGWIAEGDVRIDAISLCNGQDCPTDSVVAALSARNVAASTLEAALDSPKAMERLLNDTARRRAAAGRTPATFQVNRVGIGQRQAVAVNIVRADGSRQAAALATGQRQGTEFHILLVVSRTVDAAKALAADAVARRY